MSTRTVSETTNPPAPVRHNGHDEIGLYLRDIQCISILTRAEEAHLVKAMKLGRAAQAKLAQREVAPDVRKVLESMICAGHDARNHLVAAHARLAVAIATRYVGQGVPLADLIQEGNLGLIAAARRFDGTRGYRFSTYARWWIRHSILRALANQSRTIRLPVYVSDDLIRLSRVSHRLAQTLGHEPTSAEIAERVQLPEEMVSRLLQVGCEPLSLEQPAGEDSNSVLGDFVQATDIASLSESVSDEEWVIQLRELVDHLPGKEGLVLKLRFGLVDGTPHSLQDIGKSLGMTRERVRQIEAAGLDHLRQSKIARSWVAHRPGHAAAADKGTKPAQPEVESSLILAQMAAMNV